MKDKSNELKGYLIAVYISLLNRFFVKTYRLKSFSSAFTLPAYLYQNSFVMKTKILLVLCLFAMRLLKAQEAAAPKTIYQVQNAKLSEMYKEPYERKREVIFQNKKYHIYNNYVTGGIGKCYNSGWNNVQLCPALDFNFHIGKQSFQIGGVLSEPNFGINNCLQIHLCYGYRIERSNYMLAAYGGISHTSGYLKPVNDTTPSVSFSNVGVYLALQCFYKLKFDYGAGLTAFVDANATQILTGIRLELFFSGAYRGVKKHDYAKEENQ
jgi:hypothetical protein